MTQRDGARSSPLRGLTALGPLGDELRRRVYEFIRRAGRAVTREDVAREHNISRTLAAFHLEKLLDGGLLKASYARPAGRSGPGAGRPSKYYEPAEVEIHVSVPERRYDLAGRLMVEAISRQEPGESARDAAHRVAREAGARAGADARLQQRLRRPGRQTVLTVAEELLGEYGFEPIRAAGEVLLRNCPFHALAQQAPDLVCSVNQAFIEGILEGLGGHGVDALLDRAPDMCCVRLAARRP
jgi:predicted ArsR family transcriptional regulator